MKNSNALRTFVLGTAVVLVLSWLQIEPGSGPQQVVSGPRGGDTTEDVADEALASTEGEAADVGGTTRTGGSKSTATTLAGSAAGLECAKGKNGGATDKGVTATKIRLATTAVLDGTAKSLLEDSPNAMKAVIDRVNKSGGVCGRLLELKVVNDSFVATDGQRIIENFIQEGYFALPVVPSAEGLGSAIVTGQISKAKIPVIGTDGMRQEQYDDPWVWPVASATVTAMRVMAKYGHSNRNAKTFAIVWDEKYKFGQEGKDAFVAQVEKLAGKAAIKADIPLNPDDPSYGTKVNTFNTACDGGKCDMVAYLLLPETAVKWLKGGPTRANLYTAGAQTLFSDRFAQDCVLQYKEKCEGFAVWTGYNPPIGPLASLPGVAAYVNDVRSIKSGVDVTNQFVEGAYLGMSVFVEALRKVGPQLTRDRLKAVMDSMTHQTDLASTLTWSPGKHAANARSQSFAMTLSGGTFRGWRNEGTGFLLDPAQGG